MILTFPPQKSTEWWCYNTFSLNVFDLYYVMLHSLYTNITEFCSSTTPVKKRKEYLRPSHGSALQDSPQAHTNAVQPTDARVNQWLLFQLSLLNAGTAFLLFYFLLPTTSFLWGSITTYLILGSFHTKVARHMSLENERPQTSQTFTQEWRDTLPVPRATCLPLQDGTRLFSSQYATCHLGQCCHINGVLTPKVINNQDNINHINTNDIKDSTTKNPVDIWHM